jgi:photosystem II stability/assembly factor-like uncharacterized protein
MKGTRRWLIALCCWLSFFILACPLVWAQPNIWTNTGLVGLNTYALAADPNNPDTIYAGTQGVHVFKTTDGGVSWREMSNGLPPDSGTPLEARVYALVVDPNNSSTVYASIYSLYPSFPGLVYSAPPLFKSTDGGENWVRADFGLPAYLRSDLGFALAIDPRNSDTLYAAQGNSSQVYKTTDGGTTWQATVSGQPFYPLVWGVDHAALAVDPRDSNNVYLGLYGAGIYKSSDAGQTWLGPITGPLVVSDNPYRGMEPAIWGTYALAIDPQAPNTIYVGTSNLCTCMDDPMMTGAWKSTDGGATWSAVNTGLPPVINSVEMQPIWSLAVHPNSIGTLYAAIGEFVFKTTNGGETWTSLTDSRNNTGPGPGYGTFITSLAMTSALPGTLYVGSNSAGVYRITDQTPVLTLQSGYCATSPWTLAVTNGPPNTTIRLIGTDNGQPWEIPAWGTTDSNGSFSENGTFTEQVLGSWTEVVEVGGAHSNGISFVVSDCAAKE